MATGEENKQENRKTRPVCAVPAPPRGRQVRSLRTGRRSASVWSDDIELYSDPVNDWIAQQSSEWSEKYEGKYLAIVDYQVVAIEDSRKAAYEKLDKLCPDRFEETDLEKIPMVLYIPQMEEMEMIL
jgi:hypothetical protein